MFSALQDFFSHLAELPWLAAMADFPQDAKPQAEYPSATNSTNGGGNNTAKQDFKGRVIDRNPPKPGESAKHECDGCSTCWCGSCPKGGRWDNHDNNHRQNFLEKNKKWREAQKKKKKKKKKKEEEEEEARAASEGATANTSSHSANPPSMHGATIYCLVLSWFSSPLSTFEDGTSF